MTPCCPSTLNGLECWLDEGHDGAHRPEPVEMSWETEWDDQHRTSERPSWDDYFLAIAETVSTRSDCERSKVGAVVVAGNRIRATGYNGAPMGQPGCATCPRRMSGVKPDSSYDSGPGVCVAVHAEANALLYCDRSDLVGATLYVTRQPCPGCARLIAAAGVVRVVTPSEPTTEET